MRQIFFGIFFLISSIAISQTNTGINYNQIKLNFQQTHPKNIITNTNEEDENIQFDRWAYFIEHRIDKISNECFDPNILWNASQDFINTHKKTRTDNSNWQPIGPTSPYSNNFGYPGIGRVNCICLHPTDTNIIYAGTPDGGVWKSINDGSTWMPLSDMLNNMSIADIKIDPTNPNIIYIATGDCQGYEDGNGNFWGGTYSIGLLKSINGGLTWQTTGLSYSVNGNLIISNIAINPNNTQEISVSGSQGVLKSIDGGATFNPLLNGFYYEVEYAPNHSNIIYATSTKLMRSIDSGNTFIDITPTATSASTGRNKFAVSYTNPYKIYFLVGNSGLEQLFLSKDSIINWVDKSSSFLNYNYKCYGYYGANIAVNPLNDSDIVITGIKAFRSYSEGDTLKDILNTMHVDFHEAVFSKNISNKIYFGNDGGAYKMQKDSSIFISETMQISQLYKMAVNDSNNANVVIGLQDNGSRMFIGNQWYHYYGSGDGMDALIDKTDSTHILSSAQYGILSESFDGGFTGSYLNNTKASFWLAPLLQDSKTFNFYQGFDGGIMDIFQNNLINIASENFRILKQSANYPNRCLASSYSYIYLSKNGCDGNFKNITSNLSSVSVPILDAAFSENDSSTCYVVFGGFANNLKVFKTINNGKIWTNFSGSLPNVPVNCILPVYNPEQGVYIGTDLGVYYRDNTMMDWEMFSNNMPKIIINELEIGEKDKIIYAATYGRGLWKSNLHSPIMPTDINTVKKEVCVIYPNPANNYLEINATQYFNKIVIRNIYGSVVKLLNVNATKQNTLDISFLQQGNYFLEILDNNNKIQNTKFIKVSY